MLNQREQREQREQRAHAGADTRVRALVEHVDVDDLKRSHPVAEVVARYGIELRAVGRALVGYCPFHTDRHKPNLHVYADTDSWYCYRCRIGGDAIHFIERLERVDFRAAVERLAGRSPVPAAAVAGRLHHSSPLPALAPLAPAGAVLARGQEAVHTGRPGAAAPDLVAQTTLAAAIELYANRLLTDPEALAYVGGRGLDRGTVERYRLGYAAGGELLDFLRWRRLPREAAERVGLIGRDGHEFFAGRVVVPELRAGRPVWAVGRTIQPAGDRPKYLGLPGHKPLLGWEGACAGAAASGAVCVTEGVFDWLALCCWGVPALSLVGTHASRENVAALERFPRLYLVLDSDEAGRTATDDLLAALGNRAVPVWLPDLPGVKDVADLALHPQGRDLFARAVTAAEHAAGGPNSCATATEGEGAAETGEGQRLVGTAESAPAAGSWPAAA